MAKFIKLIVLQKHHEERHFTSYFTPVKVNGEETFITIRFDRNVDIRTLPTKKFILVSKVDDVETPKFYRPFTSTKGKTKGKKIYPYYYVKDIEKIVLCKEVEREKDVIETPNDEELNELVEDLTSDEVPF